MWTDVRKPLYRVARAILRDDGEAEDVMQLAYVNAYVAPRQFAERASFSTWLTKIAGYEALARSRRRGSAELHTVFESGEDTMTHIQEKGARSQHQAFATGLRSLLESAATSGAFQFHLSRCNQVVAGVLKKITAAGAGGGCESKI